MRWMRSLLPFLLLTTVAAFGQTSSSAPANSPSGNAASKTSTPAASDAPNSQTPDANSSKTDPARNPHLDPPRSDRVDASALPDGESSSKDSQIDLSPPPEDVKAHPHDSDVLVDEGSGTTDTTKFRYWDPHKAAKDIEVGDYYFHRKNYKGAEDRYREALLYKDNDATATFRLAVCLEKMDRAEEAQQEYTAYLAILPHGPDADKAQKAIERLKASGQKSAK